MRYYVRRYSLLLQRPSSVVLSVGLSVTIVCPAKTAQTIEMPFGYGLWWTQGSMCYMGGGAQQLLHRVSKNVPPLACYNLDTHEWILTFFGRNVTDKVGNQKALYYATLITLYFRTTWQNEETRKSHFHSCATHTMHLCAVFLKEKSCHSVMSLIASNIC